MIKTIIVLPDGTELSSGTESTNAIKNITITECVNDAQELSLGSTCSNMIELTVIAPNGGFSISEGEEITLFRENETERRQFGIFIAEKPTRASSNSFKLTAYDRVSLLDKDLTQWLSSLTGWPYTLMDLATMVCTQCGVELVETQLPTSHYQVPKFSGSGITGRHLIKWIGELIGCFCRATSDGKLEFAWYSPVDTPGIGPREIYDPSAEYGAYGELKITGSDIQLEYEDGNVNINYNGLTLSYDDDGNVSIDFPQSLKSVHYFQNSLKYEDYQVAPIQKVQIKNSQDDVGTIYPSNITGALNTYIVSGNPLTTAVNANSMTDIARLLYAQLNHLSYTPCSVTIPSGFWFRAGDIVRITDKNGVTISVYAMTVKHTGQKQTIECTGSPRRDSTTAVNEMSYRALSGKVMDLRVNVDGITTKVTQLEENGDINHKKISEIDQKADKISLHVSEVEQTADRAATDSWYALTKASEVEVTAEHISLHVSEVEQTADRAATDSWYALTQASELQVTADSITAEVNRQSESVEGLSRDLTQVKQTAKELKVSVQSVQENGTSKVTTSTGYTFGADGLRIQKAGQEMENLLDEKGMTVSRGDTVMLKADKDGVLAVDVTVRNYLIVGTHARFEDHSNGTDGKRTACFYI